jgi:hypothetical protein
MARTVAKPFEQALAYRVTLRAQYWTGSAVSRPSVADDFQSRTSSAVADPRGFQEIGRFLERLLDRARRLDRAPRLRRRRQ